MPPTCEMCVILFNISKQVTIIKLSNKKDTIAIHAGKAKVVEQLNSFLSIRVVWIRFTHLLVQTINSSAVN